jgi:hypothetical protein
MRTETRGETRSTERNFGFRNVKGKNLTRSRRIRDNILYSKNLGEINSRTELLAMSLTTKCSRKTF